MKSVNRHYTLNLVFTLMGTMLCPAVITYLWLKWHNAYLMVLVAALLVLLCIHLARLIRFPLRQIAFFLGALRNRDLMVRLPLSRDRMLYKLNKDMNAILLTYWESRNEVETRKHYYDRILKVMTHELRNTITPIVSLTADLLRHEADYDAQKKRESMEIIHSQADSISRFLNSYYQLTHLPQPTLETVPVRPLFEKLNRLLQMEVGSDRIAYAIAENMTIQADSNLLTLALINIIRNAMQAIENCPDGQIEIKASMPGGKPFITITDNGPGIPPQRIETIFLPFFTTKKNGSGIGLCLSKQILLLHNADLTVSSHPGVYTTFSLAFN